MRFVSFLRETRPGFGLLTEDGALVDLAARLGPDVPDLKTLLQSPNHLADCSRYARETADFALSDVTLLPPIPDPDKILCVGLNYADHVSEMGREQSEKPTLFTRFADTLIGARTPMRVPAVSDKLDYEGELAVVIGKAAHRVTREVALDHVAGYSCFLDGSVRDFQRHTTQFTPGKNFPSTAPFGPALVTPDEIGDVQALTLQTRVNGQVVQSSSTDLMIFDIAEIITYISSFTVLRPGDVIATGTPSGVGAKRTPPLFLKSGDTVEVEIEGIGLLSSPVQDEASAQI